MTKHEALLMEAFTRKGQVSCSATDTDTGSLALWVKLERAGYVEKNTKTGRGILGHNFSYRLTDAGRVHLESLLPVADHVFVSVGPNCWGKGDSRDEALRNAKKRIPSLDCKEGARQILCHPPGS